MFRGKANSSVGPSRAEHGIAGHSSPRTPIRGPVWIPGGQASCLSLNDGQDARPTEEGIASLHSQ